MACFRIYTDDTLKRPWSLTAVQLLMRVRRADAEALRTKTRIYTQNDKRTNTQSHTYTQTQRHADTDTQTHRHTDTQTQRRTETQTHTRTDTQKRKVSIMRIGPKPTYKLE